MQRRKLGRTGIDVSRLALGTMTFGGDCDAKRAQQLLDAAVAGGINLVDTAEMYPAPASAERYGQSEKIIGDWLRLRKCRDDIVLATKVCGPAGFVPWIRGGASVHDATNLEAALDASLRRLNTDYVDLLQLHWPDRAANFFGQLDFRTPQNERAFSIEATLGALARLVERGKVRAIGVCNETPWGLMRFLALADHADLPRVAAVQNPYNLLNRVFDIGLAEIAWREQCGLLAYSPLAFGMLSGKYHEPANANPQWRLERHRQYKRYRGDAARDASRRYVELAHAHGLSPAAFAIAWCASKPWVTSVIMGATTTAQIEQNLAAAAITITRELDKACDAIHQEITNPCP